MNKNADAYFVIELGTNEISAVIKMITGRNNIIGL